MTGNVGGIPEHILVVEDDKDLRDTLCQALELEGYTAVAAENGQVALRHLAAGSRPCLILLDLMMPVMDGWAFAREQSQDPALADLPICVITAVGTSRPIPSDAVAVVRKPFKLKDLLDVVQQHC